MIQKQPVIKLRNLKDLQCSQKIRAEVTTPTKSKKPRRKAATTATKTKKVTLDLKEDLKKENDEPTSPAPVAAVPAVASSVKPSGKSARKRSPPPSQLRINTFFKTCEKTYKIEPVKEEATPFLGKSATGNRKTTISSTTKKSTTNPIRIPKQMGGRKRLFVDDDDDIKSIASSMKRNVVKCTATTAINNECINLLSDSEEEDEVEKKQRDTKTIKAEKQSPVRCNGFKTPKMLTSVEGSDEVGAISPHSSATVLKLDSGTSKPVSFSVSKTKTSSTRKAKTPGTTSKRKPKPCPPYKIIEGTSFAVDAFQYGDIDGVSEYFLTHFHADHYIGLTKKFNKPLFMSSVTGETKKKQCYNLWIIINLYLPPLPPLLSSFCPYFYTRG